MNEAEPPATAEAQSAKPSIDREQLNALIAENGRQIAKLKARSEAPDTWTESVEQLKSMLLTERAEAIMYDLVHMLRLTNPVRATCQDLYDYANQLQLPRQERMSFACADLVFQA